MIEGLLGHSNCSALNISQLGAKYGGHQLVGKLANISNETMSKKNFQDDIFKMRLQKLYFEDGTFKMRL